MIGTLNKLLADFDARQYWFLKELKPQVLYLVFGSVYCRPL